MLSKIEIGDLPTNFQDAIYLTRELGISYLWIDSLCILQDSKQDWMRESATMGSVYAKAYCTIAGTGAPNPYDGVFKTRNPLRYSECNLFMSQTKRIFVQPKELDPQSLFIAEVDKGPLNMRAWVLQERLLSTRILHFGPTMLFFECCTGNASEIDVGGSKYAARPYVRRDGTRYNLNEILLRNSMRREHLESASRANGRWSRTKYWWGIPRCPRSPEYDPEEETEAIFEYASSGLRGAFEMLRLVKYDSPTILEKLEYNSRWYELVERYTSCHLTDERDKLIAISGIANTIQSETGLTYLAGLWKEYLVFNLLWYVSGRPLCRPQSYRAPSWSWASVDGKVTHEIPPGHAGNNTEWRTGKSEAKVIAAAVTLSGGLATDPGGLLNGGFLEISSAVLVVSKVMVSGKEIRLVDERGFYVGRFIPDIIIEKPYPPLLCVKILSAIRPVTIGSIQSYGLVVKQLTNGAADSTSAVEYERVGYFVTESGRDVFRLHERRVIRII
jgi:hypothetical protein